MEYIRCRNGARYSLHSPYMRLFIKMLRREKNYKLEDVLSALRCYNCYDIFDLLLYLGYPLTVKYRRIIFNIFLKDITQILLIDYSDKYKKKLKNIFNTNNRYHFVSVLLKLTHGKYHRYEIEAILHKILVYEQ